MSKLASTTENSARKVGVFGGTFDPIHYGHLRIALELQEQLQLDQVHFVPCHIPPHRPSPTVSGENRMNMVKLAIENVSTFIADDREIRKETPSYSIETLQSFRTEFGANTGLYFLMGMDSLLNFPMWHRWQEFLSFCHLVVAARPGSPPLEADTLVGKYYVEHQCQNASTIDEKPCGQIYLLPCTPLDIAASAIRQQIAAGFSAQYLIPSKVWSYIKTNALYQQNNSPSI